MSAMYVHKRDIGKVPFISTAMSSHEHCQEEGRMQATRVTKFTMQLMTAAVCLLAFSVAASAQKAKPAGPPVTTKGMTKANEHAAKGQATAESKRVEARERKAENANLDEAQGERRHQVDGEAEPHSPRPAAAAE